MIKLESVTTEYLEAEDRVRLTGQTANKLPVLLWLTQRLLQRLLPQLFKWLEQRSGSLQQLEALRAQTSSVSLTGTAAGKQVQQHPPENAQWLVTSINLSYNAQAMQLTFKGAKGETALLVMSAELLLQWLAILQVSYRKASWPVSDWPQWFTGTTASKQGAQRRYHVPIAANA